MAKKGSYGYEAGLARKQGERVIARLQKSMNAKKPNDATRNAIKQQIREIRGAMQGTRVYSKSGKKYKKSQSYLNKQLQRLTEATGEYKEVTKARSEKTLESNISNTITRSELNKASVGLPSIYTKREAQTFYQATQKVWDKEGVSRHDRNKELLKAFNKGRKEDAKLTLSDIVDAVLEANRDFANDSKSFFEKYLPDIDAEEFYANNVPDVDGDETSPIGQAAVAAIYKSLQRMFSLPMISV